MGYWGVWVIREVVKINHVTHVRGESEISSFSSCLLYETQSIRIEFYWVKWEVIWVKNCSVPCIQRAHSTFIVVCIFQHLNEMWWYWFKEPHGLALNAPGRNGRQWAASCFGIKRLDTISPFQWVFAYRMFLGREFIFIWKPLLLLSHLFQIPTKNEGDSFLIFQILGSCSWPPFRRVIAFQLQNS